jgi:hypothetical protein
MLTLHQIAHTVGGKVSGNKVLAPGPGHSSRDRSLMIKLDPNACSLFARLAKALPY